MASSSTAKLTLALWLGLLGAPAWAQAEASGATPGLHWRRFGDPSKPSLVLLHGGPGSNARLFEQTLVEPLSQDHHVVVYDQAGCGRSPAPPEGRYDFRQYLLDLAEVLRLSGARDPILVGHSFGGSLALRALDQPRFPLRGVVLVSTPIDYPAALKGMLAASQAVFTAYGNRQALATLEAAAKQDPASAEYAGPIFRAGTFCGLYAPHAPTEEAKAIYRRLAPAAAELQDLKPAPFLGFIQRERYTTLQDHQLVTQHAAKLGAIYGTEDWTLEPGTRSFLEGALPKARHRVLERASHGVFVDQQAAFLEALRAVEHELQAPAAE